MIIIFAICGYCMQRFCLPEFRTSCSIIKLDFESPNLKNIAFEKKCSNIKLVNMALSIQQLAGKLAKKNLSLDEKVKFLDFAKGNSNAWM